MGHLFTRMATIWLEQQTSTSVIQNRLKSTVNKRKHTDYDNISNKRKIVINTMTKSDSDDDERLTLSPRISPIMLKVTKSYNSANRSLSSLTLFKCQLCRRYLKNKDIYMDHMIMCSFKRQASIKIVRAVKDKDEIASL